MISLKRYLEMEPAAPAPPTIPAPPGQVELLRSTLAAYRRGLANMGTSALEACPAVGEELQKSLAVLEQGLAGETTPTVLRETSEEVQSELQRWASRADGYLKVKANEVKELLMVLAQAAESVGERDKRYTQRFEELTARLHAAANLEDVTQLRTSILESALALKNCLEKMAQDGTQSLAELRAEVVMYQTKFEEAEQLASRDALTGLLNRRRLEAHIERRIAERQQFCIALFDLDGFKEINDTYGHLAGDDLLKSFASELLSNCRSGDLVGRWGGDEFTVVLDGSMTEARARIERIQQWLHGDYTITVAGESLKVHMAASCGVADSRIGEAQPNLLARADRALYKQKRMVHAAGSSAR